MIRLIVLLFLLLLVLWAAKGLINDLKILFGRKGKEERVTPLSDELVKDPVCGVYCAKGSSYKLKYNNKVYYFCSPQCREKFLKEVGSS